MTAKIKHGLKHVKFQCGIRGVGSSFPKFSDTQNIGCNHPKIWTMWLYQRVMSANDVDWNKSLLKSVRYYKFSKYSYTQNICCNHSRIWNMWLYQSYECKRCRRNGKQCRPWSDCCSRSSLIWVCTVCLGISVWKLRIITVCDPHFGWRKWVKFLWIIFIDKGKWQLSKENKTSHSF